MCVDSFPGYAVVAEEDLKGAGAFGVDLAVVDTDLGDCWGLLEIDDPPGVSRLAIT